MSIPKLPGESFTSYIARVRALNQAKETLQAATEATQAALSAPLADTPAPPTSGIALNERQLAFVDAAADVFDRRPVLLIGPAGTGKTTAIAALLRRLSDTGSIPEIQWDHKYVGTKAIAAAVVAFTRRATANVRKRMPADLGRNVLTIHKLLEYAPEDELLRDPKTGVDRYVRVFRPGRNKLNKLPSGLRLVLIEEMSMLGVMLEQNILDALPPDVKLVFVGDLAQLVPVMDQPAIAKYLLKVPTIELTEVYRTALDSPIISLVTDIRRGKPFIVQEKQVRLSPNGDSKLTLHPWKRKENKASANKILGAFFAERFRAGEYDPQEDQILMPFDKDGKSGDNVCAKELNRHIGTMLAQDAGSEVFHIIAGFDNHYLRVGEQVIFDKADAVVTDIRPTKGYLGKRPIPASKTLNYWGFDPEYKAQQVDLEMEDVDHLLYLTGGMDVGEDGEKRKLECSHQVTLRYLEQETEVTITSAGDMNKVELAYCMTVHKAQGSEWRRVYFVTHHTHSIMWSRELLYTACTRAKQELYVLCERSTFMEGVLRQVIRGDTLEDKAKWLTTQLKIAAANVEARKAERSQLKEDFS